MILKRFGDFISAPDAVRGHHLSRPDRHVGHVAGPDEETCLRDEGIFGSLLNEGEETLEVVGHRRLRHQVSVRVQDHGQALERGYSELTYNINLR